MTAPRTYKGWDVWYSPEESLWVGCLYARAGSADTDRTVTGQRFKDVITAIDAALPAPAGRAHSGSGPRN